MGFTKRHHFDRSTSPPPPPPAYGSTPAECASIHTKKPCFNGTTYLRTYLPICCARRRRSLSDLLPAVYADEKEPECPRDFSGTGEWGSSRGIGIPHDCLLQGGSSFIPILSCACGSARPLKNQTCGLSNKLLFLSFLSCIESGIL